MVDIRPISDLAITPGNPFAEAVFTPEGGTQTTIRAELARLDGVKLNAAAFSGHSHAISDVTGLSAALSGKAATAHAHAMGDVTGISAALAGKQDSLSVIEQAEAQAGTATTGRIWTAQRVRQAVLAVAAAVSDFASATADKFLTAANVWSAAQHTNRGNITGTVTWDFGSYLNARAAMTGNITLGAISNAKKGQSGVIELTHSGEARTISHNNTFWETVDGQALSPSTTSGKKDVLVYVIQDNGKALVTLHKGVA